MTGLMACGVPLERVVPMVTLNAARMLGREDEVGTLRPGAVADVTVLDDRRGHFSLRDNGGTEVIAERLVMPAFCVRAGRRVEADAPILPQAVAA
jgi:dihydroorotase